MAALLFDNCCCCITLRTGSLIIGYLQLIGESILAVMLLLTMTATGVALDERAREDEDVATGRTVILAIFGILLFLIAIFLAFTITLLVGIHKNKRGHVKAYLIYTAVFMVLGLISLFVWIGTQSPYVSQIISQLINYALNIYFLLVIRSYYYKMGENKGPAVFNTA